MAWQINFLGTGSNEELGCSSAVLLQHQQPILMIDCGFGCLNRYLQSYQQLPAAIYISHLHLDHIGDLERLFYQAYFHENKTLIKLFVAAKLVPQLCERIANYPGQLAEGNANFWDCFQLIPINEGFWLNQNYFAIYPTRHHRPNTSFALHLPGVFLFSGDTRPIPELLHHYCNQGETIFHDCNVKGNPSHSGLDDLLKEYRTDILARLYAYHYHTINDVDAFAAAGIHAVCGGKSYSLPIKQAFTPANNAIKLA